MATKKKYELAKFNESDKGGEIARDDDPPQAKNIILAERTRSFNKKDFEEKKGHVSEMSQPHHNNPEMGAIDGVLLPFLHSNMVGAILFLRLPYITGQAGVILTAVIFVICVASTSITLLSLSALASNGKINKSGGIYQLVSRNLGMEFGGAMGLLFYFGKSLAASMYCLGAAESFLHGLGLNGSFPWAHQVIALVMCLVLTTLAHYVDPVVLNGLSNVCIAVALLTILFIIIGGAAFADGTWSGNISSGNKHHNDNTFPVFEYDKSLDYHPSFYNMLALYYPSVTGLMSGSSKPGSVARPSVSIPMGTFIGIVLTSCISLVIQFLFGLVVANRCLINNRLVLAELAWPHEGLVFTGICICCLGASLQSMVGSPRLLSAIAADGFLPILSRFAPTNDRERLRGTVSAVWLTWVLASVPCLSKYLDHLTPIIAIVFLLMYASVNFACFLLSVLRSPGFRPQFKFFSWHTALLGALWCLAMMFVISWWISLILLFSLVVLVIYISQSAAEKDWGDALSGLLFQQVRNILLYMNSRKSRLQNAKNWRPQVLVITRVKEKQVDGAARLQMTPEHEKLVRLAGQMKKGKGLTMVVAVIQGDPTTYDSNMVEAAQQQLEDFMRAEDIQGFPRVGVVRNLSHSFDTITQMAGIGTLSPNTIMCEWPENWENYSLQSLVDHVDRFKVVIAAKKALVVVKGTAQLPDGQDRVTGTIDVWWVVHDTGLLLLLPYLLSLHKIWRNCALRLFVVMTKPDENPIAVKRSAEEYLAKVRIQATVEVADMSGSETTTSVYEHTMDQKVKQQLQRPKSSSPSKDSAAVNLSTLLAPQEVAEHSGDSMRQSIRDRDRQRIVDENSKSPQRKSRSISLGEAPKPSLAEIFGVGTSAFDQTAATMLVADSNSLSEDAADYIQTKVVEVKEDSAKATADRQAMDEANRPLYQMRSSSAAKIVLTQHAQQLGADYKTLVREGPAVPLALSAKNKEVAFEEQAKLRSFPFNVDPTRIQVALKFNALLREKSKDAKLVVTNLPLIRKTDPKEFLAYVTVFTENIAPVLLVRGSGNEVITALG